MTPRPEPTTAADILKGMTDELKRTYDALVYMGASGPSGGRRIDELLGRVPGSLHELEFRLHVLEERGLVGHEKTGGETVWYVRR